MTGGVGWGGRGGEKPGSKARGKSLLSHGPEDPQLLPGSGGRGSSSTTSIISSSPWKLRVSNGGVSSGPALRFGLHAAQAADPLLWAQTPPRVQLCATTRGTRAPPREEVGVGDSPAGRATAS